MKHTKGELVLSIAKDLLISSIGSDIMIDNNIESEDIFKTANLIDSAPELLEALIEIREWYEKNHTEYLGEYTPICFSKGLSAILKATS